MNIPSISVAAIRGIETSAQEIARIGTTNQLGEDKGSERAAQEASLTGADQATANTTRSGPAFLAAQEANQPPDPTRAMVDLISGSAAYQFSIVAVKAADEMIGNTLRMKT